MSSTKGWYEELQEQDVWDVSKLRDQKISKLKASPSKGSSSFTSRRLPNAVRMIPMSNGSNSVQESRTSHHSAPVSVPDWSKIYGSSMAAPSSRVASWAEDGSGDEEEEEDEDGGAMVPPHELIDRRLARRQISSFSMCEGVGRTLKGRDLSRVRNDVLTKTGFLE